MCTNEELMKKRKNSAADSDTEGVNHSITKPDSPVKVEISDSNEDEDEKENEENENEEDKEKKENTEEKSGDDTDKEKTKAITEIKEGNFFF